LARSVDLGPIFAAVADWKTEDSAYDLKGRSDDRVLIIADSFAGNYFTRIREVVLSSGDSLSVSYAGIAGCPPLPNLDRIAFPGQCGKSITEAYSEAMSPAVRRVVFLSAWNYFYPLRERHTALSKSEFEHDFMMYATADPARAAVRLKSEAFNIAFSDFRKMIRHLIAAGKGVYIVLPTPMSDQFDPSLMIDRIRAVQKMRAGISKADYEIAFKPIIEELTKTAHETGAELLDPAKELCPNGFCPALDKGRPIYKDYGHLRPSYARDHISVFDRVVTAGASAN